MLLTGIYLGTQLLEEKFIHQLRIIQKDSAHDVESSWCKMLQYWLDINPKASWKKLIDALENIGQITLADQIKQEILKGKMQLNMTMHMYLCVYEVIA